jgi:energy-coupling factor transporter ATP-binding protein EcfA2
MNTTTPESSPSLNIVSPFSHGGDVSSTLRTGLPILDRFVQLSAGSFHFIQGMRGCGKSELLYAIAVQCVLPREWCHIYVGGEEKSILFIDCDLKFNLSRILQLIKSRFLYAAKQQTQQQQQQQTPILLPPVDADAVETVIRASLQRLHVIQPQSSFEFQVTLSGLVTNRSNFFRMHDVRILMIDTLDSHYYWVSRYLSCGLSTRVVSSDVKVHAEEECLRQLLSRVHGSGIALSTLVAVSNDYRRVSFSSNFKTASSTPTTTSEVPPWTLRLDLHTHTLRLSTSSQQQTLFYEIHPRLGFQVAPSLQELQRLSGLPFS